MVKKESMSSFQKYMTIGVFVLLIFVPGIAWMFCSSMIGDDKSENRTLAEKPSFNIAEIEKYPQQFDNYYNDHAPFRGVLSGIWSKLNYFAIGDSTVPDVTIGKRDGDAAGEVWLFYSKEEDFSPVRDVQGLTTYARPVQETVLHRIKNNTKNFKEQGTDFYTLIIPNKENVYREYLPDDVVIYDEKSRGEKMIDYIRDANLKNVFYAKDEIMEAKNVGQLYSKQDTHWNELGGFFGYKVFMDKVAPNFIEYEYSIDEFGVAKSTNQDLSRFLKIEDYFMDERIKVNYLPDAVLNREKIGNDKEEIIVTTNENPLIDKTVMIAGDSYRSAMVPYFERTFSKVISLHRGIYRRSLYEKYKPDIFISEAVERYIAEGAGFDFSNAK